MLGSSLILGGSIMLGSSLLGAYITKPNKHDSLEDKINICLSKVYIVDETGLRKSPYVIKSVSNNKYLLSIPIGVSISDVNNKCIESIKTVIGDIDKYIVSIKSVGSGLALLEIKENIVAEFPKIIPYCQNGNVVHNSLIINLGMDINNSVVSIDLKHNPHTYLVGCTNSGKSTQLRTMLLDLVLNYSDIIELYLIDLKIVELAPFKNIKCTKSYIYDSDDVEDVLVNLLEECKRRFNLFESVGCVDIYEYNKCSNFLKYKIVVIEEIVMIHDNKKVMKLLKKLIAIGRACGLFIIFTMQRPSCEILDSYIKANVSNRISFNCEDSKNSIIAIDNEEAMGLDTGVGVFKIGANYTKYKAYYISSIDCIKLLKPYKKPPIPINKESHKSIDLKVSYQNEKANNNIDLSFLDRL